MKNGLLAICFGFVLVFGLAGCGAQEDLMKEWKNLETVNISQPGNPMDWTQHDPPTLEAFQGVIDRAEETTDPVDKEKPEYDVYIEDKWGRHQTIVFWIGEKGEKSALAVKDGSSTIYTVSAEDTAILHAFVVYLFETEY